MKIQIHTLIWPNSNLRLLKLHKEVFNHYNISVNYTIEKIDHGKWMNSIINTKDCDGVIFCDIDCIPLNKECIFETFKFIEKNYLIGPAQVTNCIKAKHDYFCAPSFLGISKKYYESIDSPSFENNSSCDIAQQITRNAVKKEKKIKMWFPTSFQSVPSGGIWRCSGYGYYGIGTIFSDKIYHLFQSLFDKNIDLFENTVNHVLNNNHHLIQKNYISTDEHEGNLPIEDNYGL